jgi:exodeoxyribonuclease VII large subunit
MRVARKPIRVSQLNAYLARLIAADGALSDIAVTGEVSNFKVHGTGHVYFSLKDEASRIDCFLPAGIYRGIGFELKDGAEVVCDGYVNVYEKGGRYSLTIRRLTAKGQGGLSVAFEQLKKKLSEKGYFDEERKKPLPAFPLSIAIVTSDTGAALSDMLKIITSRNNTVDVIIFPTLVQGAGAAEMIASRIRQAGRGYPDTDVLIVGRGGGSSEDLAAFNEEEVADAIFESVIPVISAVGHETDFTIADFVADRRAETPTAAAMLAAPDTGELAQDVEVIFDHIKHRVSGLASRAELRLRANNLLALAGRLKSGMAERGAHAEALYTLVRGTVNAKTDRSAEVKELWNRIGKEVLLKTERGLYEARARLERLEALDPLRVLARGYAIIEDGDGRTVTRAGAIAGGQCITARFADGRAAAVVSEVELYGRQGKD